MSRPEPAVIAAAVKEFVSSLLKLLVMFAVIKLNVEQFGMLMIVFDAFIGMIMVIVIRQNVTPIGNPQVNSGTVVRVEAEDGQITEKEV